MDDLPSLPHDGSGRGNQADQEDAEQDAGPLSLSDIQLIDEVPNRVG